jgi:outer membrane protein assembly factor BamD (BamD/ComL family)
MINKQYFFSKLISTLQTQKVCKALFSYIFILLSFSSCKIYHNTTARYNGYFFAKEKMLEVETALWGSPKDNFNEIIYLYPKIDTNQTNSQQAGFDFIIKTASLPIQQHPKSKWVDYCYLLIGKTRLYQGDFQNAINTFKYINTESTNLDARHQALNWLMRTFIEQEDWISVEYVANFMSQEPLISIKNARDFYLNMSHFYRIRRQYAQAALYLEKALPDVKKKEFRRRSLFLLAQLYQKTGDNSKAFAYYNQLLKKNPSYEMEFNAQLSASGSVDFSNATEVQKAENYLKKLLNDDKNVEYKDRIYYEMANFESGKGKYDKALEYLLESVFYAKSDAQKTLSFLRAGEIAFDKKQDIPLSATYYDSALLVIDNKAENYKDVKNKHKLLTKFAIKYENVKISDRFLELAAMNEAERKEFIEAEINKEKAAIDKQIQADKRRAEIRKKDSILLASSQQNNAAFGNQQSGGGNSGFPSPLTGVVGGGGGTFYFYNTQTALLGKTNFFKEWGERPPVDNWRLSSKIPASAMAAFNSNNAFGNNANGNETSKNEPTEQEIRYSALTPMADRLAAIPKTKAAIDSTKLVLQDNLFEVGKMYYEDFTRNNEATIALKRFTEKFPPQKNTPEALYILQKICVDSKNCSPDVYQKRLREEFPKSVYARLLDNKNFVKDSNKFNTEAAKLYENAYTAYQFGKYDEAKTLLAEIKAKYAENTYTDKIAILNTMILAKTTNNKEIIEQSINDFLELYKESPLTEFAKIMLQNLKK